METKQLNFDVSRGGVQHRLYVRVGDTRSRTVTARFYSGREPVHITSAYIRALRADGAQIYAECSVEDDTLTSTFQTTDFAAGGELLCEFDLHCGERVMTSPQFSVECADLLYTGEGAEGSSEYQAYIAALMKLENMTASAVKGTNAGVNVTVGAAARALAFTLPNGDKGDTGAQGAKGDKGDSGGLGYGICETAAATAAKTAALSGYTLAQNGVVSIRFTYAVPASATLNINGTGAKSIYYNNTALMSGIIPAGHTATFVYDGSYYRLIAIDRADSSANKVTSITASSTNALYPSAKAVYDMIGDVDTAIEAINDMIGGTT